LKYPVLLAAVLGLTITGCDDTVAHTRAISSPGQCSHLTYGTPKQSDEVLCREGYALGYNNQLKSAEWVSYVLDKETTPGVPRRNDFRPDEDIPAPYRTTPEDYQEPIYSKGHLANSESIDRTRRANSETFLMSNMTPQLPGHNRAIWKGLENRERKWANARGRVLVLAGPGYSSRPKHIGNNVPVPDEYWKVIYDPALEEAIAFIIPHKNLKTAQLNNYLSSVDEVESKFGLDLLSSLDDSAEARVERMKLSRQW